MASWQRRDKYLLDAKAAAPMPGGKSYLYLVKSATGLLGWAPLNDLAEKTEGLPFAG